MTVRLRRILPSLDGPNGADFAGLQDSISAALDQLQRETTSTAPSVTAPQLLNSWANYNAGTNCPAGYYADGAGRVWLRGSIMSGAAGTTAFVLPVGMRPRTWRFFAATGGGVAQVYVDNLGNVVVESFTTWASLDGLSFDLGA